MGQEFGNKLEQALKDRNMTQKELAEKAGITEASVSHYINGDREPRSTTLGVIAGILGVTAGFLLGATVVGTNSAKESGMEEFEEVRHLLSESKKNFSNEQRLELIRLLST